jgi:hypothetical protein
MLPASILKRCALTAAITGAVIGGAPALASASSACSYNTSNHNLLIFDHSGTAPLKIFRTTAGELRFSDGTSGTGFSCFVPNTPNTATLFNTERIAVFSDDADVAHDASDGFIIDEGNGPLGPGATPESDGNSEVEIQIDTQHAPAQLTVIGTNGDDEIRVGSGGQVNLSSAAAQGIDQDVDVTPFTQPTVVNLFGRGGSDLLSGHGNEIDGSVAPYTGFMKLNASVGNDLLIGGNNGDGLKGGPGSDRYFGVDGRTDVVSELDGDGDDTATIDSRDDLHGAIEHIEIDISAVGRMKLSPNVVRARAGKPAHVKLAWKHPKAWKQLRSLTLRARAADGNVLAAATIDPAHGRVVGHGALEVLRSSKVTTAGP